MRGLTIHTGDALDVLRTLPDESVQCCVTSPPYYALRDYGVEGQIGLEDTLGEFIGRLVAVFAEVWRVLRADGTCWVNMGDAYAAGHGGRSTMVNETAKTSAHRPAAKAEKASGVPAGWSNRAATPTRIVAGMKVKDLMGQPWRLALALQDDGWYLRQDIIWHKPTPMPESVRDRCTKAHEYIFLLTKSARYFYNFEAMQEPASSLTNDRGKGLNPKAEVGRRSEGTKQNASFAAAASGRVSTRNRRSVWTIPAQPYPEAHFATYPERLPELCITAGTAPGDVVLDPFLGSGTTAAVALRMGRQAIGIELNPEYVELARDRIDDATRQAVLL